VTNRAIGSQGEVLQNLTTLSQQNVTTQDTNVRLPMFSHIDGLLENSFFFCENDKQRINDF